MYLEFSDISWFLLETYKDVLSLFGPDEEEDISDAETLTSSSDSEDSFEEDLEDLTETLSSSEESEKDQNVEVCFIYTVLFYLFLNDITIRYDCMQVTHFNFFNAPAIEAQQYHSYQGKFIFQFIRCPYSSQCNKGYNWDLPFIGAEKRDIYEECSALRKLDIEI